MSFARVPAGQVPNSIDDRPEVTVSTPRHAAPDLRGNTRDRAARRAFLLAKFGDGTVCPCYRCGITLDDSTVTADRIVPGKRGGRYTRNNIRPACQPCNSATGGALASRANAAGAA